MKPGHRTRALVGVTGWYATLLVLISFLFVTRLRMGEPDLVSVKTRLLFLGACLLILCYFFFWGGYHLLKAKGYSTSLLYLGALGPCIQAATILVLLVMPDGHPEPRHRSSKGSAHSHESPIARVVRYRRNAFLGNVFGLPGILLGAFFVIFPFTLFIDPDHTQIFGIFVFLAGYIAVITGCWWWAKAKSWSEGIVFIGLMPLAILLIPFVRVIFFSQPRLVGTSMVMMPIILVVVMFVLPDRSGLTKRKRWGRR